MHDENPNYSKNDDAAERRKYPRSEFTYPTDFKVFYKNIDQLSFTGYLKDISTSGACLQFEDKYGRINIEDTNMVRDTKERNINILSNQ